MTARYEREVGKSYKIEKFLFEVANCLCIAFQKLFELIICFAVYHFYLEKTVRYIKYIVKYNLHALFFSILTKICNILL